MQGAQEIKFGTDGWRGIVSDNFTFANVKKVAHAVGYYYKQQSKTEARFVKLAVGYDTRFM